MKKYLILTGAGISAESGIKTFRDSGGLWENHDVQQVASPQGFQEDPKLVWQFYKDRFNQSLAAEPNTAHYALKKLEDHLQDHFHLITQNVDGLHSRAGNERVIEMHGSLSNAFCSSCRASYRLADLDLSCDIPSCEKCGNSLRPDIVWFGEIPYSLYEIEQLLKECDVFMVIGTSGSVYPAAGFVMTAKLFGAHTVAVNLDRPDNLGFIDELHQGKCTQMLPALVDKILSK
ncbi:MAG: NAD-dependent deacylase [Candidatus Cloacimonadaceae bacterium]|jgi:NAD-dependent deacetylase|nr:NAD-dependent deacylase [Candidatus Cloacimonadota bacterium]MDY0126623.1 NAD-dependent deacylase [Candidatus Cloacimonadaceae bacterium]MCB5255237.1 NAD-dependent deacylase [Candidatus Cloacimonadota bacterium]MCK9177459.1 NAD-dependent deacylase [Candidatus Cloacimonadota bacterium]MCK9241943.1 NAD-dependent deacylase [Candidatus Cloacimonadota bacterium]